MTLVIHLPDSLALGVDDVFLVEDLLDLDIVHEEVEVAILHLEFLLFEVDRL